MQAKHTIYKLLLLNLFSICLLSLPSYGQKFEISVSDTIGCVPFSVSVTDEVASSSIVYLISAERGDTLGLSTSTINTSITEPGNYNVIQIVNAGGVSEDTLFENVITAYGNPEPVFSIKPCINGTVIINIDEENYDRYIIDFGDGSDQTVIVADDLIKTYSDTTPKTISVTGIFDDISCTNTSTENVTLFNNLPAPDIQGLVINDYDENATIQLSMNGPSYVSYILEESINNGAFSELNSFTITNGDTIIVLDNKNTLDNTYCYRVSTSDVCDNTVQGIEICSIFHEVNTSNNEINVSWLSYAGENLDDFTVMKNGDELTTLTGIAYNDTMVECGIEYCYELTVNLTDISLSTTNQVTITTPQVCREAISTDVPPDPEEATASFINGKIELNWASPVLDIENYTIQANIMNGGFSTIASLPEGTTTYSYLGTVSPSLCFKILYADVCGNTNAGTNSSPCPIILQQEEFTDEAVLTWSGLVSGKTSSPVYTLIETDGNGNVISTEDVSPTGSKTIDLSEGEFSILNYVIRASYPDGTILNSNTQTITRESIIVFPDAFSPNGDGINDDFEPIIRYVSEYSLRIYNKWGELVYSSDDPNALWDGRINERVAPMASYLYEANYVDNFGENQTTNGTVTLLK